MHILIKIGIAFIAIEHFYILYLEMFVWETKGKKAFKGALAPELFSATKTMAANQGLYNGFLAAGLIWSLFIQNIEWAKNIALFFIICVIVAGVYGALTVTKRILYLQAIPAIIVLILIFLLS